MESRTILVVANQTACGEELLEAIRARMAEGPCRFTLLVPATPPAEHVTWTEGSANAVARGRMEAAVERFVAAGATVDGVIGDPSPIRAIDDVLIEHPHDEIILSTLAPGISRWLNKDLPHRVEQRFALPVTTVISTVPDDRLILAGRPVPSPPVPDDELLRRVLLDVAARTPVDERERVSIERFVAEATRLERPFDEHADPVHITASALIVGPRGIVLHRHKRLGIWVQPGGHIDPGELPWDAAVREAIEETGLPARLAGGPALAHVDVHPGPRGHTHLDLRYLVDAGVADPAPPPDESQDVVWLDWPAALAVAEPGMAGILRALARRVAQ